MKTKIESVLLICNTIYPFFEGGYERRYFEIARRLARRGVEVTILTASPKDFLAEKLKIINVKYFRTFFKGSIRDLGKEAIFNIHLISKILFRELQKEYDVIDVNQTPPIHIVPASILHLFRKIPVVCTIHEELTRYLHHYLNLRSPLLKFSAPLVVGIYDTIIKNFCQHYVVVSKFVADEFVKNLNIDGAKVSVIPNGIDLALIEKYKNTLKSANKDADNVITFVGRLVIEKRPNYIIRLAKDLTTFGYRDFKVKIIGKGSLAHEIKELIKRFQLSKYVELYIGVSDEIKYSILANTDIFVLPSIREGFSIATLEAMGFGAVPVVTCVNRSFVGICGYLEYLKHGYNGFTATSYEELLKYVINLIDDKSLHRFMSKNAENTAKRYDWKNIIDNLLQVYSKARII